MKDLCSCLSSLCGYRHKGKDERESDEDYSEVTDDNRPSRQLQALRGPRQSAEVLADGVAAEPDGSSHRSHSPHDEADEPLRQPSTGRLARTLLQRQPSSRTSGLRAKMQSSSFGGAVGQRWVSNMARGDGPLQHGSTTSTGLLFQEVKPLHDPVTPFPTRFGASSTGLAGGSSSTPINAGSGVGIGVGSMGSSSMTFARSVSRLAALNNSGIVSRRASLMDVDFTKAPLQLAIGASLLRGGASSAHSSQPGGAAASEPWMLQSILRPAVSTLSGGVRLLSSSQPAVAHAAGPPAGLLNSAHSHISVAASPVAPTSAIASGSTSTLAGRPSMDWDCVRPSHGPVHAHLPPLAQHGGAGSSAYPVPVFGRSVCERAAGIPAPLVVLVLRPVAASARGSEEGGRATEQAREGGGSRSERNATSSKAAESGSLGRDHAHGIPSRGSGDAPEAVSVMHMEVPRPAVRRKGNKGSRRGSMQAAQHHHHVHHQQQQPQADADKEMKHAHAALAAALQSASGGEVCLAHAWHNAAAGALMTTIASCSGGSSADRLPVRDVASPSAAGSHAAAAPAAGRAAPAAAAGAGPSVHDNEKASLLWALRELFEEDPCLALLAKDLLRQAATRPEHTPPMTHTVPLSVYSALLGGREPFAVAAATAGSSAAHASGSGRHQGLLGAVALQAAVHMGQVRVHVCAYQMPADGPAVVTPGAESLPASPPSWQPAVILEWPAAARAASLSALPPALTHGAPLSALSAGMMSAPAPPLRGPASNAQLRLLCLDNDGAASSAALALDGGQLLAGLASGAGHPQVPRVASDATNHSTVPSLSLGIAGGPSPLDTRRDSAAAADGPGGGIGGSESGRGVGVERTGPDAGAGGGVAAEGGPAGPELAPLAGAELLYVIQTWQRHHLLLASVPYAITLFDCRGRVLQQNQGSVDYLGEVTGDPADASQPAPNLSSSGVLGGSTEARVSVASMAKAEAEVAGKVGAAAAGAGASAGGGAAAGRFGGGGMMVDASEVNVLSVLFCLCPDLLNEMLEEVICGNMWRGIVQVPRVMRPCIRAAQRCGARSSTAGNTANAAAADIAAARNSQGESSPSAVAGVTLGGAGQGSGVGSAVHSPREDVAVVSNGHSVDLPVHSAQMQPQQRTDGYPSFGATGESGPNANAAAGGVGDELVNPISPFGTPGAGASASLLRQISRPLAAPGAAGHAATNALEAAPPDDEDEAARLARSPRRAAAHRRPPPRTCSLRTLTGPTSHSFTLASPSRPVPQPHRLAVGDGPSGSAPMGAVSTTAMGATLMPSSLRATLSEQGAVVPVSQAAPPALLQQGLASRPGLGADIHFHSFSAAAPGLLGRAATAFPPRPAMVHSQSFAARSKPQSAVMAFVERLRSGRLPGGGGGGGSGGSFAQGPRRGPRRMQSGLAYESRPYAAMQRSHTLDARGFAGAIPDGIIPDAESAGPASQADSAVAGEFTLGGAVPEAASPGAADASHSRRALAPPRADDTAYGSGAKEHMGRPEATAVVAPDVPLAGIPHFLAHQPGEAVGTSHEASGLAHTPVAVVAEFNLQAAGSQGQPTATTSGSQKLDPVLMQYVPLPAGGNAIAVTDASASTDTQGWPSVTQPLASDDVSAPQAGIFHRSSSTTAHEVRPHLSVPLHRARASADHASLSVPGGADGSGRIGGVYHSTSGLPQGASGSPTVHVRGAVRRQHNGLKRPLSRSSTRSYLMTALPTSTLNVLGRVHSHRQMDFEDGDEGEDGAGGGGEPRSAQRDRESVNSDGMARHRSNSLNVTAAEPRLAVPRIFSFMRSASKRMLQLKQAAGADGAAAGGRAPPRRHASAELVNGAAAACMLSERGRGLMQSCTARLGREQRSPTSSHPTPDAMARSGAFADVPGAMSPETSVHPAMGHDGSGGADGYGPYGGPLLPPQLSRLRGQDEADGAGARMMSPRDMTPADMARRVGLAWHEVAATSFTDPVTGTRVVALVQNDVSEKVETEMQLTELMEVEHRLLEQIFPRHVLEYIAVANISNSAAGGLAGQGGRRQRRKSQFDLLKSHDCSQLAHHHPCITVLFCDVKGFTAMCSSVEPAVVMSFLNCLYTQFDSLLHVHDVYKVETIGDCYMVAGGLVRRCPDGVAALLEAGEVDPDHARKVVNFAKALLEVVRDMRMPNGQSLQVRVGIHSGPAMSGVVGTRMPRFCLFGDTINTASRCESTCPPCSIHVSSAVRDLVPEENWVPTGGVMAKGKGNMRTYLLGGAGAGTGDAGAGGGPAVQGLASTAAPQAPTSGAAPRTAKQSSGRSLNVVAAAAAAFAAIVSPSPSHAHMPGTSGLPSPVAAAPWVPAPEHAAMRTNSGYLRLPSTACSSFSVSDTQALSSLANAALPGNLPHTEPSAAAHAPGAAVAEAGAARSGGPVSGRVLPAALQSSGLLGLPVELATAGLEAGGEAALPSLPSGLHGNGRSEEESASVQAPECSYEI